jgi:hypothetical protein
MVLAHPVTGTASPPHRDKAASAPASLRVWNFLLGSAIKSPPERKKKNVHRPVGYRDSIRYIIANILLEVKGISRIFCAFSKIFLGFFKKIWPSIQTMLDKPAPIRYNEGQELVSPILDYERKLL